MSAMSAHGGSGYPALWRPRPGGWGNGLVSVGGLVSKNDRKIGLLWCRGFLAR